MKKTITYFYRGMIERGANYDWKEGFSQDSAEGRALYPWNTKRECQAEAKQQGAQAIFSRDEKKRIA